MWVERQPLWRYVPITFVLYTLIWGLAVYAAGWLAWLLATPRPDPGYMGLPGSHFPVFALLVASAFTAAGGTLGRIWGRRRSARQRSQA